MIENKGVNIVEIRENIILEEGLLYLDFTASGLAYLPIENKIQEILKTYANTHSEVGYNADLTSKYYENARKSLYKSLELDNSFCILPIGTGATGAIKKFQELIGIYISPATKDRFKIEIQNLPLVIIGPFEHHSNEVSFREGLCETIHCPLNKDKIIDLEKLKEIVEKNKNREIIGSFSSASNVTGIKNPIEQIYKIIKKYNGILCVDAAASSPYMNVDSKFYDVMFLSPHKLIGGPGSCGLLIIKKEIAEKSLKPTFAGGGTVTYVSRSKQEYSSSLEYREDAGTPGILQFIRASLSYELRNKIGLENIHQREIELKKYFYSSMKNIEGLELYCSPKNNKISIFSFNIKGFTPYFLAKELSEKYKIQTRAGCSCAGPYGHDLLGLEDGDDVGENPGWLRIGLHYIYDKKDIDFFIKSLKSIIEK
ncbi:MAG: aminotransferase class V-fold PLP-dependent enzyme [Candidatus Gracilibacteria bacterium]|nr:aminotransferase class V-fold PLP-dependent enzyme [Candidatus Gracilibacteria bacterium]MDQ7023716.1 aminotransferase class V-fold PLP-dependent enzyme [Candidatus Gracilibacteria bacterium]